MKNLTAIFLMFFAVTTVAAQNKYETLKRIENTIRLLAPIKTYVKSVEDLVEKSDGPDEVVSKVGDYNTPEKAVWKWYSSQEEFESDGAETYTTAFLWKKDGKIVQANFTYSSPSGDWVVYAFHTFYPDGKAAMTDRELRTFMGDVIVNRTSYYDLNGSPVVHNFSYRDLRTKQLISEPESYDDTDIEVFLKLEQMPFWKEPIVGPINIVNP